jgi:O-acetyl-ADP-ribose deacetylase (regulator of RNase III)
MNKITYVEGNIFNSSANLLVNPVNLAGVMGAGLAIFLGKRLGQF